MSRPALVWRTSTTLPGMLIGERDGQNLYSVDNFRRRPVYRVCALAPWSLIDETTSLSAAKIACERHWQGGNHG